MTRTAFPTLGVLALLALAPVAAAEWYEGKPECPPDQSCTMSAPEGNETAENESVHEYGPEGCIECSGPADGRADDDSSGMPVPEDDRPTYDGDCGAEMCAYEDPSTPVDDAGTCMDGSGEGEDCRDDVQYLGPPADDGREPDLESASTGAKESPSAGLLAALALLGLAAVYLRRRG